MDAIDFLTYFHSCYSHMMIVDDDDIVYLVPPNQLDWHFTLTKENEDKWHVLGVREFEDMTMTYIRDNNTWKLQD